MFSSIPLSSTLISILAITASILQLIEAKPYPREFFSSPQNATLEIRQCGNPCGFVGLCCAVTQQCYTDTLDQAQCGSMPATAAAPVATGGAGSWQYFTTTYVETDLVTVVTTFSSFVTASPTVQTFAVTTTPASSNPVCNTALNEVSCGPICCAQGQFCQTLGQCAAFGGSSPGAGTPGIVPVTATVPASSASATGFVRPTSNTVLTVTSTSTATTTVPFQTPIASDGSAVTGMTVSKGGLSGGAIAGIVIGVLLGIALLILFCVCCCAKAVLDFFLGLFGLRNRRKTTRVEETEVFEARRHSRHGSVSRPVQTRRTWYGATRPVTTLTSEKKKSSGTGFFGVFALLAALWACLGLQRRREERKQEYGTGSYYSSDYSSRSSDSTVSDDRITRQTRRSGR